MSFVRIRCLALLILMVLPSAFATQEEDPNMAPPMRDLRATEGGLIPEECKGCDFPSPLRAPPMRDLRSVVASVEGYANESPFLNDLKKRIETGSCKGTKLSCSDDKRGLVQIPLQGKWGNVGPCGSHHYRPDPPPGVDAYTSPIANCAFTAILQEWKKNHCPDRGGCTIAWGDASHKRKERFDNHSDHTNGECIDLRPLRKGGFVDGGLSWQSSDYDRSKTSELIGVMKKMGATVVLFNDRRAGGQFAEGHSNHIHVCFKKDPTTQKVCNDLKVDGNICPELR